MIAYQCGLASALHAIEAYEKGRRSIALCFEALVMSLDMLDDERDAVLRLVVVNRRHLCFYLSCLLLER